MDGENCGLANEQIAYFPNLALHFSYETCGSSEPVHNEMDIATAGVELYGLPDCPCLIQDAPNGYLAAAPDDVPTT